MVLKTLTHDRSGASSCWNYYDNIETATVYHDETTEEACVALRFKDTESETVIVVKEIAYLCNDRGGTIDKIRPMSKDLCNNDASVTRLTIKGG